MKINPKSQKGAITLIVLVTMLFLIAFLMSMYIRISNKAQTSAETTEEIAKNEYLYQPSRYIDVGSQKPAHRDFKEIAENINYITKMQNSCKLVINETIAQKLGFDLDFYKHDRENSKNLREQMASIGISIDISDYIQFTKNKNEFVFKCNDKELLPEMLLQFLSVWKNQIALLNTMQNQYLAELRDAILPDLMSGKIEL